MAKKTLDLAGKFCYRVGMRRFFACVLMLLVLAACRPEEGESRTIRMGSFPNITHVQALVARNMSRTGEGGFERYLPG